MSGEHFVGMVEQQVAMYRAAQDPAGEAAFLERYYCRMWDVSEFMKGVKQCFTQWYNGRTGRKGTLWEERFKSVVVEGAGKALGAMAAYIDLNPVRAGIVEDPKDYRWSGYGAALAGRRRAQEGLGKVVAGLQPGVERLSAALAVYRMHLYNEGSEERESVDENSLTRPPGTLSRGEMGTVRGRNELPRRVGGLFAMVLVGCITNASAHPHSR
jgi:putative transposase